MAQRTDSQTYLSFLFKLLTRQPIHVRNIAHFVSYAHTRTLPMCALYVLNYITKNQKNIVALLLGSSSDREKEKQQLIEGFVDRLERDEPFDLPQNEEEESETMSDSQDQPRDTIPINIVELLLNNLDESEPNLTHLLLGFNVDRGSVRSTDLLRNGSAILSVIVDRLDTPSFSIINADFCERCYKLIYRLCADATTGFATMAFLRATEFFMKQSRFLSRFSDLIRDDQTDHISQIWQSGWLLKTIALEIYATTSDHRQLFMELFFGTGDLESDTDFSDLNGKKIFETLDAFTFTRQPIPLPNTLERPEQFFHVAHRNVKILDIEKVYKTYQKMKQEDLRDLMNACLNWNNNTQLIAAQKIGFDAWKQILEIALCTSYTFFKGKEAILLQIIQTLLAKIQLEWLPLSLLVKISEAVLISVSKLRQGMNVNNRAYIVAEVPLSKLRDIFVGLVDAIKINTNSEQTASLEEERNNIYSSIINFLALVQTPNFPSVRTQQQDDILKLYVELSEQIQLEIDRSLLKLFDPLMRDIIETNENLFRAVGYCTIAVLLGFDRNESFIDQLRGKGLLRLMLEDLRKPQLVRLLDKNLQPTAFNELFVYESKMSLLIRIAQSKTEKGPRVLLEERVFDYLSACDFIDKRHNIEADIDEWLPSLSERYFQLLFPLLRLVSALLTAQQQNEEFARQAVVFISKHDKTLLSLLKIRKPLNVLSLQAIYLLSSIFFDLSFHNYFLIPSGGSANGSALDLATNSGVSNPFEKSVFHIALMKLLSYFATRPISDSSSMDTDIPTQQKQSIQILIIKIIQNITAYCRNITQPPQSSRQSVQPLKGTALITSTPTKSLQQARTSVVPVVSMIFRLSLEEQRDDSDFPFSILTKLLRNCLDTLASTERERVRIERKQELIASQDLLQTNNLDNSMVEKKIEVDRLIFIAEHTLVIIWLHLETYAKNSAMNPGFGTQLSQLKKDLQVALNGPSFQESLLTKLEKIEEEERKERDVIYFFVGKIREFLRT